MGQAVEQGSFSNIGVLFPWPNVNGDLQIMLVNYILA